MLINCIKCGSKATITSRKDLDPKLSQLYCACKNTDCGHTFVMDLSFKHTICPPATDRRALLLGLINTMPTTERNELLKQLATS
ncbi:ogr/Delta-like zinc finger family protein [Microbulbifer sp. GL-2]|uniref:ogr/Delta-like zinc finger family protein n=1 Tax=Microbulbifer sp. GL-2 TaxID=2591606 RepID=UPI001164FDAB|nr:hypothetical protein GL2_42560 [Microbulbifer sp. GL-2]